MRLFDPAEDGFCYRRPIIGWAFAIVLGTALGFYLGLATLWLLFAAVALGFAWKTPKGRASTVPLLLAALCLTGWRAGRIHDRNEQVLARLISARDSLTRVAVTGVVANDCHTVPRKRGGPYRRFSLDDAWFDDGTEIHGTNLLFYYYGSPETFPKTGETWRLEGKIHRNSRTYRMRLSVDEKHAAPVPGKSQSNSPQYLFAGIRDRLAKHLALGVSEKYALLTQTMLLGSRRPVPYELRKRYADAGIIHILAISGLHVGILLGFLLVLLPIMGFHLRIRWYVLAPLLLAYLLLTGIPPSAARACAMAMILCFAPVVRRRPDTTAALCLTAIGVVILEPGWIANLGAILSFGVMAGILMLMPPTVYLFTRAVGAHAQRTSLGELPVSESWHKALRKAFAINAALAISAWIGSLPLTLHYFGRLSIVGLLLNLIIPLLTLVIVWLSCISVLTGFFLPAASILLNRTSAACLELISLLTAKGTELPWAVIELEDKPGLTLTVLTEAGIIILALWLRKTEHRLRSTDPKDPEAYRFFGNLPSPTADRGTRLRDSPDILREQYTRDRKP